MPTYVFKQKGKRKSVEIQMRISELDDFKSRNPDFIQIPTAPSFRLNGTGWYETDFKTGEKRNLAKSDNEKKETKTKDKTNQEKKSKENKSQKTESKVKEKTS
tara:strand:- start:326 stop:634 length:309 start_codon:yes stop_codon:yes gene_type:complete